MPTYDYECEACGHKFEQFQSMKDEALTKCPECKKKKLRRLFGTGGAIVFKGSGFYQTDYRSESYKKSAAADSKSSSGGGDSGSSGGGSSSSSKGDSGSKSSGDK
ncbi:MAG: zinc ribbon domain-containing protein [Planctomycetes bacterium]|nr:zinc ribbon domain-containing protein [Planctomycetota bacterium]